MSDRSEALRTRGREDTDRIRPLAVGWFATIALVIAVGLCSFMFGIYISSRDLADTRALLQQLQAEAQKSKQAMIATTANSTALQAKADKLAADLDAIRPEKETYNFLPNQSLVLSNGLLTIGLVGPPGNNGIILNVNGARKPVSSGDVIPVEVDPKTSCRVTVQSFDQFKAVVHATCNTQP